MDLLKTVEEKQSELKVVEARLLDPAVLCDPKALKEASGTYADLKELVEVGAQYVRTYRHLEQAKETLAQAQDADWKELAQAEINDLSQRLPLLEETLAQALVPPDPLDKKNIVVELRAGTGGDESALFAGELLRMYTLYAERQGWKTQLVSANRNDLGGFKEVIFTIAGKNVYSQLKYESGVHRVQRVPETEKQGRVHTSTVTVAVLPEVEEVDIKIEPKDLKIDTSTAGGHGGQSVNTTYSAIRITHLPTGLVVSIQNERSQTQNKEQALKILKSKLKKLEEERRIQEKLKLRGEFESAEWGNQIRSYTLHPYKLVKDHRSGYETSDAENVLEGNLEDFIEKYLES